MRIAVIGGGVGACSLTFGLREALAANTATLHLFEMGRVAGGRATTRETREKPGLRVDHGVPAFAAHSEPFIRLCEDLVDSDVLQRCDSTKFGRLTADGTFESDDVASAPTRFRASEGKGISALCHALLRGGDPNRDDALARVTMSTMVSGIESTDGGSGWRLTSNKGADLGTFDWLVVTSTALAHPRWRSTFGGEPPLVVSAAAMGDPHLSATLEELAPLTAKPVTACLLAYEDEAAEAWAGLPFEKAVIEADETLSRVVVQRISRGLTAVVLHSTHAFAESAAKVYGAKSTAARIAGAASDAAEEDKILDAMLGAAERRLGGLLGADATRHTQQLRTPAWGPHLHRWGAAFPDAPLLPQAQATIPSARVAFCGDFVDGGDGRGGSVEGAALSGLRTAEALARHLG